MNRLINKIIIHCSASPYGNAEIIDEWHKARGWNGIGYHYVIGNCYPDSGSYQTKHPKPLNDGRIEAGRDIEIAGAHAKEHNENSVGICLIGDREFTSKQLESLSAFIAYRFPDLEVVAHYELNDGKTCPNINADYLRELIDAKRV